MGEERQKRHRWGKIWREGDRKEGEEERGPELAGTDGEKSVFV